MSARPNEDDIAHAKREGIQPAFYAKVRVLNAALAELGMGRYQWERALSQKIQNSPILKILKISFEPLATLIRCFLSIVFVTSGFGWMADNLCECSGSCMSCLRSVWEV